MTRCNHENTSPATGIGWTPPEKLTCHLETPRLIVRAYTIDDAQSVFEAVNDSRDEHLLPWMSHWAETGHRTIEFSTKYVCDQALALQNPASFNNVGTGIFEKSTGRFVGGSGVHDIRRDTASCETGYWIRRDAIGHGYALEACAHTITWALQTQDRGGLGLNRVRIYCAGDNIHSANLIAKLGITPEVMQRADYFIPTIGLTDRLGWGVLASEWDCDHHRPFIPAAQSR
ncbi:MAG: GNAT family N-acetyltransferase [Phycisphaerales bacterium]|nr:GNAT family N-acetyltransferase [Phycisphaerales bacterium]